jgi:chloride channel 7
MDGKQGGQGGLDVPLCCVADTFNDLATAFFSVPNDTIKHIFSLGQYSEASQVCQDKNCYFTLRSLMVLCPTYLIFMTLIGGLAIPGGLFIPSILV